MSYIFSQSDLSQTYKELQRELDSYLENGKMLVKEGLPEDTFELTDSVKIKPATRVGPIISGEIFLDPSSPSVEYAEFIEYGVPSGDTRNYYKNTGRRNGGSPFMSARTGTRAWSKAQEDLEKIIR